MDQIPCPACCTFFTPRNRSQTYCPKQACQKARKALWQELKLATDPEYKKDQRLSQQKWLSGNPDYYRNYLRNNPEKADRNRVLQRIRNDKAPLPKIIGIAKMDAVKIFITTVPGTSP